MVPTVESASLSIAAVVGTATAITQNPVVQEMGVIGAVFTSPIGSAIIAGLVAFGTIKTSIKIMERDLSEVRRDVKDLVNRVARIEGTLEAVE